MREPERIQLFLVTLTDLDLLSSTASLTDETGTRKNLMLKQQKLLGPGWRIFGAPYFPTKRGSITLASKGQRTV